MNNYSKFLGSGLFIATLGELVNNFIITIPGHSPFGNFVGAMFIYGIILSIAYQVWKKFQPQTRQSLFLYMIFFGLLIGLFLIEWILVGNNPLNPNTSSLISQLSMITYHTLVYTFPVLVLSKDSEVQIFVGKILRGWLFFTIFTTVVLSIIKSNSTADFVLGTGIILTYFIGYNVLFLIVVHKCFGRSSPLSKSS